MPDGAKLGHAPGTETLTAKEYRSGVKPTWCPGCGDFGVLSATSKALAALQLPRHEVVVVSGIGCSSRTPYFMSTFGFHGVHGRALPIATGMKLARPSAPLRLLWASLRCAAPMPPWPSVASRAYQPPETCTSFHMWNAKPWARGL